MLKKNTANIIVSVIAFAVTLLVCAAMFLPRNVGNLLKIDEDPIKTYSVSDVESQVGCTLSSDGKYTIEGADPQLIIPITDKAIECIEVKFDVKSNQNVSFEVYTAYADGAFSAERCYKGGVKAGQEGAIVDLPKDKYSYIRLDINVDNVTFKGIETFDKNPQLVPVVPEYRIQDYLITIIFPIVVAVAMWFINRRFKTFESIVNGIYLNRSSIAKAALCVVAAIVLSALIELIFGAVIKGVGFNFYRWLIMAAAAEIAVTFVLGYKNLRDKPENVFLPLVLILGALMLFGSPIKHICWDFDSHYPWAIQNSYPITTYITGAYEAIDKTLPQTLVQPGGIAKADLTYLVEADKIFVGTVDSDFSLAHLPAGVFIAVARFFGAGFVAKYNLGRLAYLLAYAVVCYFAIKKLKSGKMILAIICLFPTNLFLATNYSYDWCVTSFCMLGTAYFVSELQQPDKPITIKDTIVMGVAFALGALPKLIYIVLMGMTLFMRKNWISKQEKRRYYLVLISIFAVVFMMFVLRASSSIGGSGDSRGGAVNPPAQLAGIFENPLNYVKILFNFLSTYLAVGTMEHYISNFAYLGIGINGTVFIALLVLTSLVDSNRNIRFKVPLYMRALAILLYVGMAALIASALYLSFTPVGHATINGCQPRYMIPLLAPLLLLVTGQRFSFLKCKGLYNGCVLGILSTVVIVEAYSQMIKLMI